MQVDMACEIMQPRSFKSFTAALEYYRKFYESNKGDSSYFRQDITSVDLTCSILQRNSKIWNFVDEKKLRLDLVAADGDNKIPEVGERFEKEEQIFWDAIAKLRDTGGLIVEADVKAFYGTIASLNYVKKKEILQELVSRGVIKINADTQLLYVRQIGQAIAEEIERAEKLTLAESVEPAKVDGQLTTRSTVYNSSASRLMQAAGMLTVLKRNRNLALGLDLGADSKESQTPATAEPKFVSAEQLPAHLKMLSRLSRRPISEKHLNRAVEFGRQLSAMRERTNLLRPIGGKLHLFRPISEGSFDVLRSTLGVKLDMGNFRLDAANCVIVPPAFASAYEYVLYSSMLIQAGVITPGHVLYQFCGTGRLNNANSAILGSAMLLTAEDLPDYQLEDFNSTTDNAATGRRLVVYDAGGRLDVVGGKIGRPDKRDHRNDRTDVLGMNNPFGASTFQLVQSILSDGQFGGPLQQFADQFRTEYFQLLERYGLLPILDVSWVNNGEVEGESGTSTAHFKSGILPCMEARALAIPTYPQGINPLKYLTSPSYDSKATKTGLVSTGNLILDARELVLRWHHIVQSLNH